MTERHKQWVEKVFDCAASQYGEGSCSFFNYFGKQLVQHVPVVASWQALDIATGKGAVLFPLAEKVGSSGRVVGIDISRQMIEETSIAVKKREIDWINLFHMDAEELDFPENSFDAVFCGFSLSFFPSLSKALSEFQRVLKPGGFLAVSTWGNESELDALVNKEINMLHHTTSLAINPIRTAQALQNTLQTASFGNIKIIEDTKKFLHNTPEEWWQGLWSRATRAKLEQLSNRQVAELQKKINQIIKVGQGNELTEIRQAFYGTAQKN